MLPPHEDDGRQMPCLQAQQCRSGAHTNGGPAQLWLSLGGSEKKPLQGLPPTCLAAIMGPPISATLKLQHNCGQ